MSSLTEALAPRSDQLNADDLIPGPRTIKITGAKIARDGRQLRITLSYEGDNGKPFKPCKTMGRAMVMVWGITDENYEEQFRGKSIRVYRDPDVKFGDQGAVGGIRISHMSHIDKPARVKLTVSQGKKAEFVFQPLPRTVDGDPQPRQQTKQTPEQWVAEHKEVVDTATSLDELAEIEKRGAPAMDKLAKNFPELHAEVRHAYSIRRDALNTPATSDPEPPADHDWPVRDDDQHGDQHDDSD